MAAPLPPFYAQLINVLRVAGILALAGIPVGFIAHEPGAFRLTAGAFAVIFLGVGVAFAWAVVHGWRTRGSEQTMLLPLFGAAGWCALAAAAAVTAGRPWGPLAWRPTGMLLVTALACLTVCFAPVLLWKRRAHP